MFKQHTYAEKLASLEELRIWMKSKNINFDPSRYGIYKKILEYLEYHRKNNSLDEYAKTFDFKEALFSFFEVDELLFIFEHFRNDCPEQIRIKLGQVVQGPIDINEEDVKTTSNHPRNILFELKMQAVIRAAGLQEGEEGDASCVIENTPVIFQCKRPQNYSSIKKNVSKARKQLRADLSALHHVKSKGVIAISVGKIFHEGYKYLNAPSTELLGPMLSDRIKNIVEKSKLLKEVASEKKILGLLCNLSTPVIIDSEKMIYAANQFDFFPISELLITQKLSDALNGYFHPRAGN